jgi:hypothetical protein
MDTLDWAVLRFQHTAAIRSQLAERYAPATANKMLSAIGCLAIKKAALDKGGFLLHNRLN